ncbi:hypothetical protein Ctob_013104, partial [Chrysochromulina tobinii]
MELALATLVAATFQGRRLHRAYQLAVDKSMIARVHGAVLIGGAPAMIAVIFAPLTEGDLGLVAPSKWSPPPPVLFGGFGSRFRPSAPLRRFDAALDAKYQRHRRSATAAREVGSPEPRSPPRSPGGWAAPEFIQGHPAAFDAESLWRFTSRLRAHGESLDGWAAAVVEAADALDEAASLEAVMPSSPSPRVELASPRDEDVAGLLHWILLVLLALLTTIPAFVVWEESGRTLPHDEVILIGMVCLQIAFIVHGATL